jgi:aminopeptidase N
VYQKGAEVVRMMANTLGQEGFRRGTDRYFEHHDGQAVTVEDFIAALSDGSGQDLSAFLAWYRQAGTPHLTASGVHDAARRVYELEFSQHTPPTQGESTKAPIQRTIRLALLDGTGRSLPLRLAGEEPTTSTERVFLLREGYARFVFQDVAERPVPSLLRGFSAPVQLMDDLTLADRLLLLRHDSDPVVRWQAAQQVWINAMRGALDGAAEAALSPDAIAGFACVLADPDLDPALAAELLALPAYETLLETFAPTDPCRLEALRQRLRSQLAQALEAEWLARHAALAGQDDPAARALRNRCLGFLMADGMVDRHRDVCLRQFSEGATMTERLAALALLVDQGGDAAEAALRVFHDAYADDDLVLDKWFRIQAQARQGAMLQRLDGLMKHPAFRLTQPNKVRAVVGAFARGNPLHFHAADGSGYAWVGDRIATLVPLNPQLAARLTGVFAGWRELVAPYGDLMRAQLERLAARSDLPPDMVEVVGKMLAPA